jgi:hypothetical protein
MTFRLQIAPDTLEELKALAAARGITLNELIVMSVEHELLEAERTRLEER